MLFAAEPAPQFAVVDWLILGIYLCIVIALGVWAGRKRRMGDDFFLAGRSMPMWAVAISVLATAQSAATFVGGPQEAYDRNLTYLTSNIGPILAALVVAFCFIPAFYRRNVTSVYELIGHDMGAPAQRMASAMFMLGRVFASGARLFIVAIPFALVAFGDMQVGHLLLSIIIVAITATLYSSIGGIRAVIWTDVMQVVVYLICITIALVMLWNRIPLSGGEMFDALRAAEDGNKMLLLDWRVDLTEPYTVWASVIGITLLMIAAYGADQDLTQRMLTCRTRRQASGSVITATLLALPVVFIFLLMGLLLFIFFRRPDLMGDAAPAYAIEDSRRVFLSFILNEMPMGVRGLMMAGLFAAAMSSMDSALNAMSSTTIADFVRPWRKRRNAAAQSNDATERRLSRLATLFWAALIAGFACICVVWHDNAQQTLIAFALGVMTYAYSGLLGVFFTLLFSNRGNTISAMAALVAGFMVVFTLDTSLWTNMIAPLHDLPVVGVLIDTTVGVRMTLLDALGLNQLAFAWRLTIATCVATIVCQSGRRQLSR